MCRQPAGQRVPYAREREHFHRRRGPHTPALVSVVVVLVALVCRIPVTGRCHFRDDLAAELGLHRRDDFLRCLLLLLGVVEDGAPDEWLENDRNLSKAGSDRDITRSVQQSGGYIQREQANEPAGWENQPQKEVHHKYLSCAYCLLPVPNFLYTGHTYSSIIRPVTC